MPGSEHEQGRIVLNSMVARWQADHIFLWTQNQVTQALSNATQTYSLPVDPQVLSVDKAFLRRNSRDTEIEIIGWDDFQDIPDKSSVGTPHTIAIDYTTTTGTIYTYPTQAVAGSDALFLFCTVKLTDFDTSTATPDSRSSWLDALSYGLADNLSDEYSLSISERQHIAGKAINFYNAAKKNDVKRPDYLCLKGAY